MAAEPIPALRAIEMVPIRHDGRDLVVLRDPQGIAAEPLIVSLSAVGVLRLFDGEHTLEEIQLAITQATGQIVPADELRGLVARLDRLGYLDSLAYLERRGELSLAYREAPQRAAQFAGQAYPAEPGALRVELNALYDRPGGPGRPDAPGRLPRGLVAPHIDPQRGGAVYAQAYRHLWGTTPRRVVILGILHAGGSQPFVLTTKDFATPLGVAPTEAALVAELTSHCDWDPLADEFLHQSEHSIEFQVLLAQHALSCGGERPVPPETHFLPILCAFPWQWFAPNGQETVAGEALSTGRQRVDRFLEALATLLANDRQEQTIIAGVDFAHVGRRFGDPEPLTDARAADVRDQDRATLERLAAGDRAGFVAETVGERDARRICGFSALYALLGLLPGMSGRRLAYDQSRDTEQGALVSFAALRFPD